MCNIRDRALGQIGHGLQAGVVAILLTGSVLLAQTAPTWEELEARQAKIVSIEFRISDVFDPTLPHENHWLGRAANVVHIETREQVVRREILFHPGEVVNARLIHETERNLRSFRFLAEAWIEAQVDETGAVHAVVHTQDAWTLKGSAGFSQVGGQRDFGFSLHEANVFGFGKDLTLAHEKTPERSIDTLTYLDRQFLGSEWTFGTRYQSLSDGKTQLIQLARPYRSLQTPWSMTFVAESSDTVQSVYNLEQSAYSFRSRSKSVLIGGSWAAAVTGDRALRLGGGLDLKQTHFGPLQVLDAGMLPPPFLRERRLQGIHFSWGLFEERPRTFKNLAGMTHSEDFNLGWDAQVNVGSYLKSLGSEVSSPFVQVSASNGWAPGTSSLLLFQTLSSARHESDGWQDASLNTSFTSYHQGFPFQTQAAYVQLDAVVRPAPEKLLYLGGLDGMRGYGNHLLQGDRRWMASLEERVITSINWLGILQLGFVMYADGGAIRRTDTGEWSRTYVDVGGGLRLGNLKSSVGRVILFTIAFPLVRDPGMERHQYVVGNLVKF
jgi:hypothetical protein